MPELAGDLVDLTAAVRRAGAGCGAGARWRATAATTPGVRRCHPSGSAFAAPPWRGPVRRRARPGPRPLFGLREYMSKANIGHGPLSRDDVPTGRLLARRRDPGGHASCATPLLRRNRTWPPSSPSHRAATLVPSTAPGGHPRRAGRSTGIGGPP